MLVLRQVVVSLVQGQGGTPAELGPARLGRETGEILDDLGMSADLAPTPPSLVARLSSQASQRHLASARNGS